MTALQALTAAAEEKEKMSRADWIYLYTTTRCTEEARNNEVKPLPNHLEDMK